MRLANKTVLVTAAGQGIGHASVLAMAAEGATVWATDVNPALLDSFAGQEVAKSWETGKTLVILLVWLAIGLFFSVRKFKWDRD